MGFAAQVLKDAIFIGELVYDDGTDKLNWNRHQDLRYRDIVGMGDIVYFMFNGGELKKIGQTAGIGGFQGRVSTYIYGNDQTNKNIKRLMQEKKDKSIKIYALQCPRVEIEYICPLTGETIKEKIKTARTIETRLTSVFLSESETNTLEFCVQLK